MQGGRRIGVVLNPIAGMGGRVGLHGTDGPALAAALARGAEPVAPLRARRALVRLRDRVADTVEVVTAGGAMGEDVLAELGWPCEVVYGPAMPSGPEDTCRAVAAMVVADTDLLLFVGGDGTARDVLSAAPERLPMLGVPAGVKMHSAVFATSPESAADTAARFLAAPERVGTKAAEVVDIADCARPRLFGTALVPALSGSVQAAKAATRKSDDAQLAALGREVVGEMERGRVYLLGPGTTVAHINAALGLPATVIGVDAVLNGRLIGADLGENDLRSLLEAQPTATLILGVVGGQGFLLGRGNQQLSPAVIAAIGADNIMVLAAASKLAALDPPVLRIDLGDAAPDAALLGYRQVRTGPGRSTVMRISS